MVHPTPRPSHLKRVTLQNSGITGFVPIDSGGTARDSHPLPLLGSHNGQHNRRWHQTLSSSIMLSVYSNSIAEESDACERSVGYGTIRTRTLRFHSAEGSAAVALQCEICQKKPVSGNNVSHANNKTRRVFNPNIQTVRAVIGKSHRRIRVCTRCLRSGLVRKAV